MLRNFRFIVPGKLAGMGHPGSRRDLPAVFKQLRKHGITAIVSLDEEGLLDDIVAEYGFAYRHYPIDDFCAPDIKQAQAFVGFVDQHVSKGGVVAAHCWAGIGRTGTMLACYLVHRGESAKEAQRKVRRIGGIESREQEEFLIKFEAVCRAEKNEKSGSDHQPPTDQWDEST